MRKLAKKGTALIMILILVFSFTACGSSSPKTMSEAIKSAGEIENGEIDFEFSLSMNEEEMIFELFGDVNGEENETALTACLEYGALSFELLTFTFKDHVLYLDFSELFRTLGLTDDVVREFFRNIGLDTDALASSSVYALDFGGWERSEENGWNDFFTGIVDAGISADEEAVTKNDDGSFTMSVTNDNLAEVCAGMLQYTEEQLDTLFDPLRELFDEAEAAVLSEVLGQISGLLSVFGWNLSSLIPDDFEENLIDELEEETSDVLAELEDAIADYVAEEEDMEILADLYVSYSGKSKSHEYQMNFLFTAEEYGDTVTAGVRMNRTEKEVVIKEPENATDLNDLLEPVLSKDDK